MIKNSSLNDTNDNLPTNKQDEKPKTKKRLGLLDLPLELQAHIYEKYLSLKEQLKLREIHPLMQALVDDYIGFQVTLSQDDPKEKLDFISEKSIRKVSLVNMSQNKTITEPNEQEDQPSQLNFEDIFFYPQYVQEIIILGDVDANFFNGIIRKCKVVENLELSTNTSIINNYLSTAQNHQESDSSYNQVVLPEVDIFSNELETHRYLPRCRTLKLVLNDQDAPSKRNCEAILAVLKSVRSPFLQRIVMQNKISEHINVSRAMLIAAQCLQNNPSLESFFAGVVFDHLPQTSVRSEEDELRELIKTTFKKAGVTSKVKKLGISSRTNDLVLWKEFIKSQINLVHLSLTVDVQEGVFSSEMFSSCRNTLIQFVHRGKYHSVFDFEWVQNCHKLKEICLHNIDTVEDRARGVHAANISLVPEGVESLILFQMISKTDDLIVAIKKLKQLDTLVLFKTGNQAGETGVDFPCLRTILSIRTLESVLLVRFVASNPVEAAAMIKIMHSVNQPEIQRVENQAVNNNNASDDVEIPPLEDIEDPVLGAEGNSTINPESNENCNLEESKVDIPVDIYHGNLASNLSTDQAGSNDETLVQGRENEENVIINGNPVIEASGTSEQNAQQANTSLDESIGTCKDENSNRHSQMKNQNEWAEKSFILPVDSSEPHLLEGSHFAKVETLEPLGGSPMESEAIQFIDAEDVDTEKEKDHNFLTESNQLLDPVPNESFVTNEPDEDWNDLEGSSSSDDDDLEADDVVNPDAEAFDLDLQELMMDVNVNIEMVEGIVGGEGNDVQNFQIIMDLQNEGDLEDMLGMLGPIAEDNGNNNNIFIGFLLDGIIDVMNKNSKGSRWTTTEDEEGHLNYNLQICID